MGWAPAAECQLGQLLPNLTVRSCTTALILHKMRQHCAEPEAQGKFAATRGIAKNKSSFTTV